MLLYFTCLFWFFGESLSGSGPNPPAFTEEGVPRLLFSSGRTLLGGLPWRAGGPEAGS